MISWSLVQGSRLYTHSPWHKGELSKVRNPYLSATQEKFIVSSSQCQQVGQVEGEIVTFFDERRRGAMQNFPSPAGGNLPHSTCFASVS